MLVMLLNFGLRPLVSNRNAEREFWVKEKKKKLLLIFQEKEVTAG